MASRKQGGYTPYLQERVYEAVCVSKGLSVEEVASVIYSGKDGGPDWSLSCVRVAIFKLRKQGRIISNKPDRTHFGKTGRATKAIYREVNHAV